MPRSLRRARWAAIIVIGLASCRRGASSTKIVPDDGAASAPSSEPRPSRVVLSIDDAPVEIASTYAFATQGPGVGLVFARKPLECAAVTNGYAFMGGDAPLVVVVAPRLAPDGTRSWHVVASWFDHQIVRDEVGEAVTVGAHDALAGGRVRVAVSMTRERKGADDRMHRFTLEARVDALGCGPRADAVAPDRPQTELALNIAGETIPLHGAVLRRHASTGRIELTSAAADCDHRPDSDSSDVLLSLRLDPPHGVDEAELEGSAFAQPPLSVYSPPAIAVSLGYPFPSSGTFRVELNGAIAVGPYALRLSGWASVLACEEIPFPLPL